MIQAELRAYLRRLLAQDETNPDDFGNTVIDPVLDQAVQTLGNRLRRVAPSLLLMSTSKTYTGDGTNEQSLPDDFLTLETAWLNDKKERVWPIDADQRHSGRRGVFLLGTKIGLAPLTLSGTVHFDYSYRLGEIAGTPDALTQLPVDAHRAVALEAAVELAGPEAIDPISGQTLGALLQAAVNDLAGLFGRRQQRRERVVRSPFR